MDHHPVAEPQVFLLDKPGVVQGGARYHATVHKLRLELRHRRDLAGTTDLERDRPQFGRHLFGGELIGNRPAWGSTGGPEVLLEVEPVDLDHHSIDLVAEVSTLRQPLTDQCLDPSKGIECTPFLVHAKAPPFQPCQNLALRSEPELIRPGQPVEKRP